MCPCVGLYTCEFKCPRTQKVGWIPQELYLQMVASHSMWVLGTELKYFAKGVCALNC